MFTKSLLKLISWRIAKKKSGGWGEGWWCVSVNTVTHNNTIESANFKMIGFIAHSSTQLRFSLQQEVLFLPKYTTTGVKIKISNLSFKRFSDRGRNWQLRLA
jgi:hypothetical protein